MPSAVGCSNRRGIMSDTIEFHDNGKPKITRCYKNGKLVSTTTWYKNGIVASIDSIVDNKRVVKHWDINGKLTK